VAEVLTTLRELCQPGITTLELDKVAEEMTRKQKARPAFKGYHGFPATLCTSINEEVVHGIPSRRILKEGDIVSIDYGVFYRGYYGDAAISAPVGKISPDLEFLLQTTEESLISGLRRQSLAITWQTYRLRSKLMQRPADSRWSKNFPVMGWERNSMRNPQS